MKLIGVDTLIDVAQRLSALGHRRREVVDFFLILMYDFQDELTEEQLDTVDELSFHLSGTQCQDWQIIRLCNDPEDPSALAEKVYMEMKGWVPSRG